MYICSHFGSSGGQQASSTPAALGPQVASSVQMLLALDFRFFLPEMLLASSWWASIVLLVMGIIQVRGLQAFYQDFRRQRGPPPVPPPAAAPEAAPVPPPAPAPEAAPAPERVPEAVPPPPPVVRHYIRTTSLPDDIWVAKKSGQPYHIFQDCQYIYQKAQVKHYELCTVCQQKQRARQ